MIKMNLEKLADWPSPQATKRLIYIGMIVLWINYPFLIYFLSISNYPVTYLESQLSFSGAVIKSHFKGMSAEQINYYRMHQLLDNVYDFSYITMFFGLSLYLARQFAEGSGWRKSGFIISMLGIVGAVSDVIENTFMLMILTDPLGFPDIWAIAHSWLALIKFILWGFQAVWIIWAGIKLFKNDVISKKSFLAALGVVFSQHWPTILTAIELIVI
jgi:hypothetical protein